MLKSSSSSLGFHEKLANEIYRHILWVNKLMGLHNAPYIDDLSIVALLEENVFEHVDVWIRFALEKRIQNFKLDFSYCSDEFSKSYTFPSVERLIQLQALIHATSASCCLRRSINEDHYIGIFCCLKSFSLCNIDVTNDVLEYLMSNCQFLEQLSVVRSKDLVSLRVIGSKLKSFQIIKCFNLRILEILAEKCESITYDGPKIDVPFRNVPSHLLKLTVGEEYGHSFVLESHKHLIYVCQLECLKLTLSDGASIAISRFRMLPQMINLKHLELLVPHRCKSIVGYIYFLVACPLLSTLKIKYELEDPFAPIYIFERYRNRIFQHHHLEEAELVGFAAGPDIHFVEHLIKTAVSLRKLVLQFEEEELVTYEARERAMLLWRRRPQGAERVVKLKDKVLYR